MPVSASRSRERQAGRTAGFLETQLDDAKKQLDDQERRASEFRLKHVGELPQQVDANLASLERLNTKLRLNGELVRPAAIAPLPGLFVHPQGNRKAHYLGRKRLNFQSVNQFLGRSDEDAAPDALANASTSARANDDSATPSNGTRWRRRNASASKGLAML